MNGFLSNLAARATGDAIAVRPRLPSRFETKSNFDTLQINESIVLDSLSTESGEDVEAQTTGVPRDPGEQKKTNDPPDNPSLAEPRAILEASLPQLLQPERTSSERTLHKSPPQNRDSTTQKSGGSSSNSTRPVIEPANVPPTEIVASSANLHDNSHQNVAKSTNAANKPAETIPNRLRTKKTISKSSLHLTINRPAKQLLHASKPTLAEELKPQLKRALLPDIDKAEEPSTTVNVSIGHVEITTPVGNTKQPASPTKPRRKPVLSLDDYLRKRNGGQL